MSYKPILFNTVMVKAIQDGRKTQTRRVAFLNDSLREFHTLNYPEGWWYEGRVFKDFETFIRNPQSPRCKYKPGDILWVRETWCNAHPNDPFDQFYYKADMPMHWDAEETAHGEAVDITEDDFKWHPSIHMPKEAARIFLRVKDVRVERLCQITPQDAVSEGISRLFDHMTKAEYEEWANRSGVQVPQHEQSWTNYLWHGRFGVHGMGNQMSNAWPWQASGYEYPRHSFSSLWNSTVQLKDWDKCGWYANPWVWVIEFERCERPADFS